MIDADYLRGLVQGVISDNAATDIETITDARRAGLTGATIYLSLVENAVPQGTAEKLLIEMYCRRS